MTADAATTGAVTADAVSAGAVTTGAVAGFSFDVTSVDETVGTPSRAPRPRLLDVAILLVAIGFGATVGVSLTAESRQLLDAPGGWMIFLGNLTGLAGTYLALVMVLLVSRLPFVERILGQDGLLRWHRRLSPWPLSLIFAHAVLLTVGYAEAARTGFLRELGSIVTSFQDLLIATIALGIMVIIGVMSIRRIRQKIRRERWWALHLLMYLALALAFAHEIVLGPSFVGHPLTRIVWSVAWASTAGVVLGYRFGLPAIRSIRHRLVVVEVRPERPGVVSVLLKGRNIERLAVAGGQFFEWRFLCKKMWWQTHPFSISARPRPPYLRLTVKAVGDFTEDVARLKPGTRVLVEGPYGAFTRHARRRPHVVLIAGGIGVTAVRALLEDLPDGCDPVVVLRATKESDLVLGSEVASLVARHGGRLHEMIGSREEVPLEQLTSVVDDLLERDTYVAGPEAFVESVVAVLRRLGVPREQIHFECYAL